MNRILDNRLLLASLGALALYWIVGLTAPDDFISLAVAFALFVFGALTFYQYTPSTYRILFYRERSEHAEGSHLAAFGIWLLSAGAIWSGTFSVLWHWYSQPETWLSTPWSAFGRAMISGGFFLMYIAPENATKGIRINAPLWIGIAIAIGMAIGAVVGFQWTAATQIDPWRFIGRKEDNNPVCPPELPVWVSSRSNKYHTPESQWYGLISPSKCFRTVKEAEIAGYRPALP